MRKLLKKLGAAFAVLSLVLAFNVASTSSASAYTGCSAKYEFLIKYSPRGNTQTVRVQRSDHTFYTLAAGKTGCGINVFWRLKSGQDPRFCFTYVINGESGRAVLQYSGTSRYMIPEVQYGYRSTTSPYTSVIWDDCHT